MISKIEKYIIIISIIISFIFSYTIINIKKNKYNYLKFENNVIKNNINDIKNEINDYEKLYYEKTNILSDKKEIIDNIILEIENNYLTNNDELKRLLLYIGAKSEIKINYISEAKTVYNFFSYKLCDINLEIKSSLISLGKFLYYINKIEYYIDTTNFYMKLSDDRVIINISYITKEE